MTVREFMEMCASDVFIAIRHPRYDEDGNFMEYYADPNTWCNDELGLKIPNNDLNRKIVGIRLEAVPGCRTGIVLDTVKGNTND